MISVVVASVPPISPAEFTKIRFAASARFPNDVSVATTATASSPIPSPFLDQTSFAMMATSSSDST